MIIYCLKCKSRTDTVKAENVTSKNNKPMIRGECKKCGTKKYRFLAKSPTKKFKMKRN